MAKRFERGHRLDRASGPSVRSWQKPAPHVAEQMTSDVVVDMGWGRLIFAHTFASNEVLAETLKEEEPNRRDIAFYLRDPHVLLSLAPQDLFLDPSHTFRLWSHDYRPGPEPMKGFITRRLETLEDAEATNGIYAFRKMVTLDPEFMLEKYAGRLRTYLVAHDSESGRILGTVTGVDHVEAFNDPEKGSSLWCLAVDPRSNVPGVGEGLVRHLVEHYFARGRTYVDLSVMHDNASAIRLYEKLGFQRVPVFCVKRKNPINEALFIAPEIGAKLNPYAEIIVNEARRRGIVVEVEDEEFGLFTLRMGGRSVTCRESLSELTTAVAMVRCDDKRLTRRAVSGAGLAVPPQRVAGKSEENREFLEDHERLVVKPARGEQGSGVSVDVRTPEELEQAVASAATVCKDVLLEKLVVGDDLRVIVIDYQVVAAAVRRPPTLTGTGRHTVSQLIEKYSRRRAAATGGESRIPVDAETERCVRGAGYEMDSVPEQGQTLQVRKTANLHTGGTIHDVTAKLNPKLNEASVKAARALDIPVVGLDFIVPDVEGSEYWFIEANERPGLANHEPQPTAQKFVDLLFPQSAGTPS
jgi:GNAT-family acetyltransferase (TIGR03103 family)